MSKEPVQIEPIVRQSMPTMGTQEEIMPVEQVTTQKRNVFQSMFTRLPVGNHPKTWLYKGEKGGIKVVGVRNLDRQQG